MVLSYLESLNQECEKRINKQDNFNSSFHKKKNT